MLKNESTLVPLPNSEDEYRDYDKEELPDIDESQWLSSPHPATPPAPPLKKKQGKRVRETTPKAGNDEEVDDSETERRAAIKAGKKRDTGADSLTDDSEELWYGTISVGTPASDFTGTVALIASFLPQLIFTSRL